MAGIGVKPRRLWRRDGLAGPAASLGHGAIVAAGPWIFTVLSIAAIYRATAAVVTLDVSYSFRGLVIYAFALSLLATAPVVSVAIRQVADDIFLGELHEVRSRYLAALVLSALASCGVAFLVFALVFGISGLYLAVGVASTTVVGLIWPTLAFCGALRDYSSITVRFLYGLLVSVAATVWGAYAGWGAALMMVAFTAGLGIVFFGLAGRVLSAFPYRVLDPLPQLLQLVRGFHRYWMLALGSAIAVTALWVDKWIMWFGPFGVKLANGLISAPIYDGAMFIAYLVIIPALGLFVISTETVFLDAYRGYLRAIRDHGPLSRIFRRSEALERQSTLLLTRALLALFIICGVVAMAAPALVGTVGLQFQQIGILRLGVLAAFCQFLFLACTSLLLFCDQHGKYLMLQVLSLALQTSFTLLSIELGLNYYGFGHLVACAASSFAAVLVLDRTFRKLEYLTFAAALRQNRSQRPSRPATPRKAGNANGVSGNETAQHDIAPYFGKPQKPLLRP